MTRIKMKWTICHDGYRGSISDVDLLFIDGSHWIKSMTIRSDVGIGSSVTDPSIVIIRDLESLSHFRGDESSMLSRWGGNIALNRFVLWFCPFETICLLMTRFTREVTLLKTSFLLGQRKGCQVLLRLGTEKCIAKISKGKHSKSRSNFVAISEFIPSLDSWCFLSDFLLFPRTIEGFSIRDTFSSQPEIHFCCKKFRSCHLTYLSIYKSLF
jgi:hypothetical protein